MVREIGFTVGRLIGNHMWPAQKQTQKHEMRPIATDVSCVVVRLSVGSMSCATTVEPIEVPFGVWTWVDATNDVLGVRPG